ncbi:MAG: hypothetical protein EOO34_00335 [Cyanobacteriota bacterium]|nr:MAG: hypothetical protein EOO34_00335 [Cyanobacteriota bacterium]
MLLVCYWFALSLLAKLFVKHLTFLTKFLMFQNIASYTTILIGQKADLASNWTKTKFLSS